jgi:hypothetical protein
MRSMSFSACQFEGKIKCVLFQENDSVQMRLQRRQQLRIEAILGLVLLAIILLSGCISSPNCVVGSGNVVNETRPVESFNSIDLRGSGALLLSQGPQQPLRIEAEDNIHKVLTIRIESGKLIIGSDSCISATKPIRIYATAKDILNLEVSGSGTITGENMIQEDSLNLKLSGSGSMDLDLNTKTLRTVMPGSGAVLLRGSADDLGADISGSGKIAGYKLNTKRSEITISGSGVVEANVSDEIAARINGSGAVYYRGHPELISEDISGSGVVRKTA